MSGGIDVWDAEGGAAGSSPSSFPALSGTAAQVEWAERIRSHVDTEFDRVAGLFRSIAARQDAVKRAETEIVLAILEDKRAEIMKRDQAGYFISNWQEIGNRVQKLIRDDPRYEPIQRTRGRCRGRE